MFKMPMVMRKLARCPYKQVILSSILCGLSVTFLCCYLCKRGIPFVNYLKPMKLKPVYEARYESLDLSEKNSSCWKIISGDPQAVKNALLNSITIANKYKGFTEIYYLTTNQDCDSFVKNSKYITFTFSAEERDFPLAYCMVVNENIERFERLLRGIYAPQNVYCVNVDRKSLKPFHSAVQAIASCFPNVFVVRKLDSMMYASWSRVQADLKCMEELLRNSVPWRYLINVCGKAYPIKTNWEIVNSLMAMNGLNFIDSVTPP